MCFEAIFGGGDDKPKLPPPVDPAKERLKAENEATAKANAEAAAKRKARRGSSLLASGAKGVTDGEDTAKTMAKAKLGA